MQQAKSEKRNGDEVTPLVNLTSVGILNGVPNTGTGTVSTIDALLATLNANGGSTPAGSAPVVPADQYAQYKACAVSSTTTVGVTGAGATGDYLAGVLVSPATAGCGNVIVLDNATAIATFPGGATTALADLKPFIIPVGLYSTSGAWKVTCGANVTATAIGKF